MDKLRPTKRHFLIGLIAALGLLAGPVQANHNNHHRGHSNDNRGYNYRSQSNQRRQYGYSDSRRHDNRRRDNRRHDSRPRYRGQDPIRMHNRYYRNGQHRDKEYHYSQRRRSHYSDSYGYDYRGHRPKRRNHHGGHGHYHRHDPVVRLARRLVKSYFYCEGHGGYFRHNDLYYYD